LDFRYIDSAQPLAASRDLLSFLEGGGYGRNYSPPLFRHRQTWPTAPHSAL
jgi:hypothetical protein